MPGLTVTEKPHWRDRIAARIARAVERIKARHPALFDRIAREAHAHALASLGLAEAHAELEAIKAEEVTLARRKKQAQKAMIATLRSTPIDEVTDGFSIRYGSDLALPQEVAEAIARRQAAHQEQRLADDPIGREIARLEAENDSLLDTIWLATSPTQIKAALDPGRRAVRRRADDPGARGPGDRSGEGGLMPRPYRHRRRRRPGRRPPNRHPGGHGPPRPAGFTGPGFDQMYRWVLPGLGGSEKKRFFNEVGGGIVLAAGLCGSVLGLACFGWMGAILGLGVGVSAGGSIAESQRFFRE